MTLRLKTTIFSALALLVICFSAFLFQEYRSTNKRLNEMIDLLDEIRVSSKGINDEIIKDFPDIASLRSAITDIPSKTNKLQKLFQLNYKPTNLIDLEIMFVRIRRIIDKSLPGQTIASPLQEQIHNETAKVEQTVYSLQNLAQRKVEALQSGSEFILTTLYIALVIYIFGSLLFLSRMVVNPILALSRQIEEVRQGVRDEIEPLKRTDEIGRLNEFARSTITELATKNIALLEEVKERELVQEKFKQSALTLENVLNSSNPICITDINYNVVQANKAYYEIWPNKNNGSEYIRCYDSRPGSLCHTDSCPLKQILNGTEKVIIDSTKIKENGEELIFIITARPFRDAEGRLIGIVESFQDITDRKRTEAALASERERLAVTLRSIGDGVITTDTSGIIVLMNKVAEDLTGWSQNYSIGKPLEEVFNIVNEKTRLRCDSPVEKVLQTGKSIELANHTLLIARGGNERSIADSAAPIIDEEGCVIGVVLVFRDVTEKRRLEKEFIKIKKLESLGVLAGGIAHDFNNILSAVLGNINVAIQSVDPNDTIHEILQDSESAVLRARTLTQQLLTFSKGGEPVKRISPITSTIKDSADFILRGSNIRCNYQFQENLKQVEMDTGQISQVIQNIILNAKEAMPDGGAVDVICENMINNGKAGLPIKAENLVKITLKDHGDGIPPALLEKIFDPYFTTKEKGSGLGLAICHSIIKKHGGHILVESNPGKGTIFTIYLIASEDVVVEEAAERTYAIEKMSGTVLVMDDEEIVRNVAERMLTHLGYSVIFAKDGEEAIGLYKQKHESEETAFEFIIMDLTIPGGMGGKDAVREILTINPEAKVIVSSGYSNDPVMANYKSYGFKAIVTKPYKMQELMTVIKQIV